MERKSIKELLREITHQELPINERGIVREIDVATKTCTLEPINHPDFDKNIGDESRYIYDVLYAVDSNEDVDPPQIGGVLYSNNTDSIVSLKSTKTTSAKISNGVSVFQTTVGGYTAIGGKVGEASKINTKGCFLAANERFAIDLVGESGYLNLAKDNFSVFETDTIHFRNSFGSAIQIVENNINNIVNKDGKIFIGKIDNVITNKVISTTKTVGTPAPFKRPKQKPAYNEHKLLIDTFVASKTYKEALESIRKLESDGKLPNIGEYQYSYDEVINIISSTYTVTIFPADSEYEKIFKILSELIIGSSIILDEPDVDMTAYYNDEYNSDITSFVTSIKTNKVLT